MSLLSTATWLLVLASAACSTANHHAARYHAARTDKGGYVADTSRPHQPPHQHLFSDWLHQIVKNERAGDVDLKALFLGGVAPKNASIAELRASLNTTARSAAPKPQRPGSAPKNAHPPRLPHHWDAREARQLLHHLPFDLDEACIADKANWWYRTYDGSCNWLKASEAAQGSYGQAKSRDYDQHAYADGIAAPREGPNPRAVSNAFFQRNQTVYYEHTPLLLGLIEFVLHDVTWSPDSATEYIDVPVPDDEPVFPRNTTLRVYRTEAAPGTGTSLANPRENLNRATTWIDVSSLYGSTRSVALSLRTMKGGKLRAQQVNGTAYLPFDADAVLNGPAVPVRGPPGVDPATLFAGGDPRTNEDWVMLAVHTLMLREHNRLCDILAQRQPELDDEGLYQTVRLLMSAKFQLIANSYQMAYFRGMPWPQDDGFPLFREMMGRDWLQMNPANAYPWPLAMKHGRPTVVSAEMAVVYRFHEFIIEQFPLVDADGATLRNQSLFATGFDAHGFLDAGLDNVLRGVVSTTIPNFKSGVDEAFRSAGAYRGAGPGHAFDIVVASIVHEREQGLPTFNNYFRAYNAQRPHVAVPIRARFEDFTSDPAALASLRRLYATPDDVDLVVGCQLDETLFPHTSVPTSSLIVSLFNLISMGNADRFSVGYAATRCLLVDTPWDCHPSNALEALLWKRVSDADIDLDADGHEDLEDVRFYDDFWMAELDFQAHGQNLLWRLVTENTDIHCLQQHPLFPADPVTNPILCVAAPPTIAWSALSATAVEVSRTLLLQHGATLAAAAATAALVLAATYLVWRQVQAYGLDSRDGTRRPRVLLGWPLLGEGLAFQKDAKAVLLRGFATLGTAEAAGPSRVFGMRLGPHTTHYVLSDPADLQMMRDDNPYGVHFDLNRFFASLGAPLFLGADNFATNLHATLIRTHLGDPATVRAFTRTMDAAARDYLAAHPLVPTNSTNGAAELPQLAEYMDRFSTYASARCMLGGDVADAHPELTDLFLAFNSTIDTVMQLASVLPAFLHGLLKIKLARSYRQFHAIFGPIIARRRQTKPSSDGLIDFMPFILQAVADDDRASNLVAISVWIGLRNLQVSVLSTLLDVINEPGLADRVAAALPADVSVDALDTFAFGTNGGTDSPGGKPWALLRSAALESIRLCGTATGPARIINSDAAAVASLALRSDPRMHLPAGQVATLSPYYTHRQPASFGPDAAHYRADRFLDSSPALGTPRNIAFGLQGPRMCPGQWFVQAAICVMMRRLLAAYTFAPAITEMGDAEKYAYQAGLVRRNEVPVRVARRQ